MNSLSSNFKMLFMEPIKRKVVFLGMMFFLTLATFITFQAALQHFIEHREEALADQHSRRELGNALIYHLIQLELSTHKLYQLTDSRDIEVTHKEIQSIISDIKNLLTILQHGGVFEDTLQTNFEQINQIKFSINYRNPFAKQYNLEIINITPKIVDLEQILSDMEETVRLRLTGGDSAKASTVRHADTLFKQARTVLLRSAEQANKIFHDTQIEIQRLKAQIEHTSKQFAVWRSGVSAVLLLLSLVLCRRALRQISLILKERHSYLLNLRKAHKAFQHIAQVIPVGIVVVDQKHKIKRVNEYALKALKLSQEDELIGKRCNELFCDADLKNCPLICGSSEEVESEMVLNTSDGGRSIILKKAIAINLDDEPVVLEAFIDITAWKQAEKAAGEKQNFINAIFQSVTVGIVVIDAMTKTIIDANPQALRILKGDRDTLVGQSCLETLCPHSDKPCPVTEENMETLEMECELQSLDNRKIPIIKKIAKVNLNNRECIIESFIDIRRLKKAEETVRHLNQDLERRVVERTAELGRANKDLEAALHDLKQTQTQLLQSEKMASIGQLAAGVAHEINNPVGFVHSNLNTIKDYNEDISKLLNTYNELTYLLKTEEIHDAKAISLELERMEQLKAEIDLDFIQEDYRNVVTESLDGLDRVIKIVADLKNFAHAEGDEMTYADINAGINVTLNIVWNEIKYKAEVDKELGDLPEIRCFPQKINQVLMNLLVNAAQAIEETGRIHIRSEASPQFVTITISDTGCGISSESLTKIFDPFFTTKEVGKGTGLGLHVVYNIINSHNGSIEVASEVGKGTTFTIHLPVDPDTVVREEAVTCAPLKRPFITDSGEQSQQPA